MEPNRSPIQRDGIDRASIPQAFLPLRTWGGIRSGGPRAYELDRPYPVSPPSRIDTQPAPSAGAVQPEKKQAAVPPEKAQRTMTPFVTERPDMAELIHAAAGGDQQAWNSIVERYLPLVVAITQRFRLSPADQDDVSQSVWLTLVRHIHELRQPDALPGWLATTTRHLCLRSISSRRRIVPMDTRHPTWEGTACNPGFLDQELLRLERRQAVRVGLGQLPSESRNLLTLLVRDPPMSYGEISEALGIPVGSIGPTRARCLRKLRETSALRAYLREEPSSAGGDCRASWQAAPSPGDWAPSKPPR